MVPFFGFAGMIVDHIPINRKGMLVESHVKTDKSFI